MSSSGHVLTEVPAPAVDLLVEFLASVYGPAANPMVHLACYAPGALVLVGDRVERREDVDVLDYVEAVEAAQVARSAAQRRGERAVPAFEFRAALECRAAADVAAVRSRILEVHSGREFEAVFVFEDAGVLGAFLLPDPQPELAAHPATAHLTSAPPTAGSTVDWPDPHVAQAMVAAEFAQPPSGSGTDSCLTGLELSYDRLHGGTLSAIGQYGADREFAPEVSLKPPGAQDLPLRSLPEARFSCSMCGESCRAGKWRNAVSDSTRLALDAMPWSQTHPGLLPLALFQYPDDEDPDEWRGEVELGVRSDGFCVFFDGARGCMVHGLLGRQPIPSCHQFPFAFTRTPDGLDVWTTFHCHAALEGHGVPLLQREADIRSRLWATRTPQRWIGRDVPLVAAATIPWPAYRAVEEALLDFLDVEDPSPLASRLHAAENFVQAVVAGEAEIETLHRTWRDAPLLTRPLAAAPDPLVAGLVVGLYKRYPPPAGRLPMPEDAVGAWLAHLPPVEWEWPEPVLARYLRHTLFHKHFLQTEGALFTWRMAMLSYAVVRLYAWSLACFEREGRLVLAPRAGQPANQPAALPYLQKAIQDNDRLVIHAGTYFARFLKGYPAEYERLMGPGIAPALIWA